MKFRLMTMLAVLATVSIFSCEETPQLLDPDITAGDVTVEEGKTARIFASCNSPAPISYTSDNTAVATVSADGEVTGVKAGSAHILLRVEAVESLFNAAEKTITVTVTEAAPVDNTKPQPGTYTFTASPLKGQWKAGDNIHIRCGYGPACPVVTLEAGQISADGKTASVDLSGDIFKYILEPDPLYAVWPAEAVQEEDGLATQVVNFTVSDILLTQAYLEGRSFVFKDVSACISFSVSGGFDKVIIAGEQRPGLRYSDYKNEYSSAKSTPAKPKDDGYPFREEQLASDGTPNTIWFPGGMNFRDGFTLYFGKGDSWTASYTYPEEINLKAGKLLELGDLTAKLSAYDGPKPHMPEIAKFTKYTVQFNELSGICVDLSGDFVWILGDGSQIGSLSIDGKLLNSAWLKTTTGSTIDSEGLSINYDTGDILISGEPNVVCRISKGEIPNIFNSSTYKGVESLFKITDAKNFGNAGAEGCTYYKDNLVYVGTQTGSYLYCCDLATGEVLWRKDLREKFQVITEIAGLSYDPLTDWLWVIDSEAHKFFALTGDAERLLGSYPLKTRVNEESLCVDHKNSCIWVGDDYGETSYVYRYDMSGLDDFLIK